MPIVKKDKEHLAEILKTSLGTVERYGNTQKGQESKGEEVDLSNKRKGKCGIKRKDLGLERIPSISRSKVYTLRELARELHVPYSTLQKRFIWDKMRRHASNLKPLMQNIVHVYEKWFDMAKKIQTYYLLTKEQDSKQEHYRQGNVLNYGF
jgi:hypothetical protein